jgi:hypothetical protein
MWCLIEHSDNFICICKVIPKSIQNKNEHFDYCTYRLSLIVKDSMFVLQKNLLIVIAGKYFYQINYNSQYFTYISFEVFTVIIVQMVDWWIVTPCSLVGYNNLLA